MNTEERYTKVNSSTAQEDQAGMSCGNSTEGPKTRVNPNTSESTSTEAKTKVNPASSQSNTGEKAFQGTRINPNTSQDDFYSNSNEFSAGEIFADKYRVESVLDSSGGEAIIYVCSLVNDAGGFLLVENKKYCLKIYKRSDRIQQSVRNVLLKIEHSNIAKLIDFGGYNNTFYEVFELYEGETLSSFIKKKLIKEEDIELYVRQMNEALNELHKNNITHQDIKPSNFMIMEHLYLGEEQRLKLFDFGISSLIGDKDGRTHVTTIGKTHIYSAPEVLLSQYCWPASDYYSMGITLIELLTGKTPFEDYDDSYLMRKITDMQEINIPILRQFSPKIQALVVGLLQFERQDRWGYTEIVQWLSGHYSDILLKRWLEYWEKSDAKTPVFSFLGKDTDGRTKTFRFAIPSQIPALVTRMAYNWNEGITEISEQKDTKGQFTKLLVFLNKILSADTNGFTSEENDELWRLQRVCNSKNTDGVDAHIFYLQKLFQLYPQFKLFAWRGFVAKDSQSLGNAILQALWEEELRRETSSTFSFESSFGDNNNSDKINTLRYAVLKYLFEKHVVSWYLKTIQDKSYEAIARYENSIVACAIKNDIPDYYYYKIGYLLSGSSAVQIAGIKYKDRESFLSYLNTLIEECALSGDLSKFQSFIHSIYNRKSNSSSIRLEDRLKAQNEPTLEVGVLAWLESQGLQSSLEILMNGLREK